MQSPTPLNVLVIDDEANIRMTISMCLSAEGHRAVACGQIDEALDIVSREAFDLIFLDLRLGIHNGLDYIKELLAKNPWSRIIVITAYASVETAVEAMKRGASDYLPKPFEAAQVQMVTRKVAESRQLERRIAALQATLGEMDPDADLCTDHPTMRSILNLTKQISTTHGCILISGEFGVGKVRLARAVHGWSDRAKEPFAIVSCNADNAADLQTQLFGPANASGAMSVVERCDRGTLVLDEVADLPLHLQPHILRLIKDKDYERQDDVTRRRGDVRIIATTSTDLRHAVQAGTFRSDLYLALSVVQIDVPPLRARPCDITLLAERYLAYFGQQNHRAIGGFTLPAGNALLRHSWPGNVRELRNVIERAVLLCRGGEIGVEHLPPNLLNSEPNISIGDMVPLAEVEELHIRRVVASARSLRQAASILGIDSGTVVRRVKRYQSIDDQPAA